MLTPNIESCERGTQIPKHTIANAATRLQSGRSSGKRCRTGHPRVTTGKCRMEGGKVVGTLEGLHYEEGIWNAMTTAQKSEVMQLHRKPVQRSVQAATSSGTNVPMSDVSDSIVRLTRAIKSLETLREGNGHSHGSHSGLVSEFTLLTLHQSVWCSQRALHELTAWTL